MKLASMTISSKFPEKNMGIRFQSGHGNYSKTWFIQGDHKLFQHLYQALNYSIFGLDEEDIFQNSSLELIDQDGVTWEILRKRKQSWVMKDKKATQLKPEDLLGSYPLDNPDQASGRYQLSFDQNDLFMSSLNPGQEKDQLNYSFIKEHTKRLLKSIELSFDQSLFSQPEKINQLRALIEPIWVSFKQNPGSQSQAQSQENKQSLRQPNRPNDGEDLKSVAILKDQLNLMSKVKDLLDKLVHPSEGIDALSQRMRTIETEISGILQSCGLTEFNEKKAMINWNVPLQCLCYLNVLDQLTPVLTSSLTQIKTFFKQTVSTLLSESGPVQQKISDMSTHLHGHRDVLVRQLKYMDSLLSRLNSQERSIWQKLTSSDPSQIVSETERAQVKNGSRKILAQLDNLLNNINNIKFDESSITDVIKPLEDFLGQTLNKKEALNRHWKLLCQELSISETICLHDFLQFIMKLNELVILHQKCHSIKDKLQLRKDDLLTLREQIIDWYSLTGSQKMICLKSSQMILTEAQNLVRYRSEKIKQLKYLEENHLELEIARRIEADQASHHSQLLEKWTDAFTKTGLPVISPYDPRTEGLIEKLQLFKSLEYLRGHLSSLKLVPAFNKDWNYETMCFWKLSHSLTEQVKIQSFLASLKRAPIDSYHIIFIKNNDHISSLRQAGMGQIVPFWEAKKMSALPESEVISSPTTTSPIGAGHPTKVSISKSSPVRISEPLAPQVQAVVDLLNGNQNRN